MKSLLNWIRAWLSVASVCLAAATHADEMLSASPAEASAPVQPTPASSEFGGEETTYLATFGLTAPDLLTIQLGYRLSDRSQLFLGMSPGLPYPVTIVAPADEEVVKSRLKAGTPETEYDTKIRFYRNFFLNYQWRPFASRNLYFLGGAGYRKMHVTTEGKADLYVCLVTAEVPCNKDTETFPSRTQIHLESDIETVSYNFRAASGWKFEWDNNVFVDWTIIGFVLSRPKSQSITVRSELRTEQDIEEANEILSEMESYLKKKEDSIRSRVVDNVEKVDRLPLPYFGVSVGYRF
jgi:hypothetical protein